MPYFLFEKYRYVFFLLLCLPLSFVHASPLIIDNNAPDAIDLSPHYQLFIDPSHAVTINDILAPSLSPQFKFSPASSDNFGFRPEAFWLKIELNNILSTKHQRLLEFNFPLLDDLNIYIVHGSSNSIVDHHQLGDLQPFSNRPQQHSNFVIPVTLPAQSNTTLYFRITSTSPMSVASTLWKPDNFLAQSRLNLFLLSLYAGALLALIAYNFLLFISLRDISYLYYTLFASAMLLAIGSFNGLWYEVLWPNNPSWHRLSASVGFILAGIFATLFSRSFLNTITSAPKLDKVFLYLTFALVLTLIASLFISLHYVSQVIVFLAFLLCLTALFTGVHLSLQGNRSAMIYLLAWTILIVGVFLLAARNSGWLPDTIITRYAIMFGSIFDMVLLSFALAYRITLTSEQTDKFHRQIIEESNQQVTKQVAERTQDLTDLNQKLNQKEDLLKKLAFYDSLTGLANRTFVMEQLEHLLTQTRRKKTKVAVLFLDLDDFKPVNDKHGHNVGDEVLTITANRLRSVLRDSDMVGRLGGDEFVVLLESVRGDNLDPTQVADKIRAAISQPITIDWFIVNIATSIGIARYPNDGDDAESLLVAADAAMYLDKATKTSRNQ